MTVKKIIAGLCAVCIAASGITGVISAPAEAATLAEQIASDPVYRDKNVSLSYRVVDDHVRITFAEASFASPYVDVVIPEKIEGYTVTEIGERALSSWYIGSVTLPDTIESIGDYAFYNSQVKKITLPDGLRSIGDYAFSETALVNITIPSSVESIGSGPLSRCTELKGIEVDKANKNYCSQDGALYSSDMETLISVSENGSDEFTVPEGVKRIVEGAFCGTGYSSVILPDTLEVIEDNVFYQCGSLKSINIPASVKEIGESVFSFCSSLESITADEKNEVFSVTDNMLTEKEAGRLIKMPACADTKKCIIPDYIKIIECNAFQDTLITSVKVPEGVEEIPGSAFFDCSVLSEVQLPETIRSIGDNAFFRCSSLTSFTVPESVEKIGVQAFWGCSRLEKVHLSPYLNDIGIDAIPANTVLVYTDSDNLYTDSFGAIYSADRKTLITYPFSNKYTYYNVPEGTETIGENAFSGNSDLRGIALPDSLKTIENSAFRDLRISSLEIPEGVTTIGDHAFEYCISLRSVSIPDSVSSIGKYAFRYCSSLENMKLSSGIKVVPEGMLNGCHSMKLFEIPDGVTEIDAYSLPDELTDLYIPESVTDIDEDAFADCIHRYSMGICGKAGSQAQKTASKLGIFFVPDSEMVNPDPDVNKDGAVNIIDCLYLKSALLSDTDYDEAFDVNYDGVINAADLVYMMKFLLGADFSSRPGYRDISSNGYICNSARIISDNQLIRNTAEFEEYMTETYIKAGDPDVYKKIKEDLKDVFDDYDVYIILSPNYRGSYYSFYVHKYAVFHGRLRADLERQYTDDPVYADGVTQIFTVAVPKSVSSKHKLYIENFSDSFVAAKPVVYLYPETETEVNVKVDLPENSTMAYTYPKYPENGWTVTAEPDSTLYDENGREYSYLFWEADSSYRWDMSDGFVVKGEDTVEFLQEKLEYLGLTPKEYNDFIVYWMPRMQDNRYNLIRFQTDDYDRLFRLEVTPEPDSIQRVFMTYTPLDEYQEMPEQKLEPFERHGFSVIEWGGAEIK